MPSRERWIVYPILFLALGLAMRPQLDLQEIRCRRLVCGSFRAASATADHLTVLDGGHAKLGSLDVAQIKSHRQITGGLQIAGGENDAQMQLTATSEGGRIDFTRYAADVIQDNVAWFVRDSRGINVQLGDILYRKPPKPKPAEKADRNQSPPADNGS